MSTRHTFTDADFVTVINALRLAAERYDQHAATLRDPSDTDAPHVRAGYERLAQQFDRQAAAACLLADRIENTDEADETPTEDTGQYAGGYRTFRDGSSREDFGADR